jgi:hypothetical protein
MIKHIVVWRLKASAHGNDRATNARLIKEKLESLRGRIPGMIAIENSADIVLYSEFASRAALDAYQSHPEHQAIMPFILEARDERRMVDYEI